ncbi:hypothetical protein [Novosphingobium sp.]|uniref:hypothetical protein n=1 Tax=Novosphingobium sp. TaxID=1874826 RepID=UPI0027354973|nr:hypothetical protein [Novosphingobium sp.]MDP3907833.1 hypothetical protein [Novosphingobium sp.]
MIDYFALALTHGLLLLGAWRMLQRADLDREEPVDPVGAPPAEPAQPPATGPTATRPAATQPGLRTRA